MSEYNPMPTLNTITVSEAYEWDNTLFEKCIMDTAENTSRFKDMFLARWGTAEIGSETIGQFKIWITNKFNIKKDYYIELLKWQKTDIVDLESDTSVNKIEREDLPNKHTTGTYLTDRDTTTYNEPSENIARKLGALELIRNIWEDFMNEFSDCMSKVY